MSTTPPPPHSTTNVVLFDQALLERRGRGRPRSIGRAPTPVDRERRRLVRERLERHIAGDELVQVAGVEADRASMAAIDRVMMEIARESSALRWDRELSQSRGDGQAAERISSRRVESLGRLAALVLEKSRSGLEPQFDTASDKVQRIVQAFVDEVDATAREALGNEADAFLESFMGRMTGWEARVPR
jgi:hypothetical protein